MKGMARVTISLPAELLEAVDRKLANGNENRSAVIRRVLEEALRAAQEREDVEQFIRAYTEQPETEEEFGWLSNASARSLAEVPFLGSPWAS